METNPLFVGVDVSKEWLDVWCRGDLERIDNAPGAIRKFLKRLPKGSVLAMEATGEYHLALADSAYVQDFIVYVLNPRVTHHYQEALAQRGTTDPLAARAIASFIECHHRDYRPYVPASPQTRQVRTLMRRRAKLTECRTQLRQSASGVAAIRRQIDAAVKELDKVIARIDALVDEIMEANDLRERLRTIAGVGSVTSAIITAELEAHDFISSDAFVAFCGLDPRPRDSGKHKGRRHLSRRGSKSLRTAFFMAAFAGIGSPIWSPYYAKLQQRGLAKTQCICVIARKIARIAWSIQQNQTVFNPLRVPSP